jgi:hypothetical protein
MRRTVACSALLIALLGMSTSCSGNGEDISDNMQWKLAKSPVTGQCYEFSRHKDNNWYGMSSIPCSEFEKLTSR